MPKVSGFFTRTARLEGQQSKGRGSATEKELPADHYWKLGLDAARSFNNPDARNPNMEPAGIESPDIYVLGDHPNKREDQANFPLTGHAQQLIEHALPDHIQVRFNNCIRTWPKEEPDFKLIEINRPSIVADIERTKPKVIVGLGILPLKWMLGKSYGQVDVFRGRYYPVKIGTHVCWFIPTSGTRFILERNWFEKQAMALKRIFWRDFQLAVKMLDYPRPPVVEDESTIHDGVVYATEIGFDKTLELLKSFESLDIVGIDIETNRKRPYHTDSKILSIAIGTYEQTLVIPLDHPENPFTPHQKELIWMALAYFFRSPVEKVAHNVGFELEWLGFFFGKEIFFACKWHCTMAQAYILDERTGALGLDDLCLQHFGLHLKSLSDIDVANLIFTPLRKVMSYNAPDTKYADKLFLRQERLLKEKGMLDVYEFHVQRSITCALAQLEGALVDKKFAAEHYKELTEKVDTLVEEIHRFPEVKKVLIRSGEFNPDSPEQVAEIFQSLGYDEVEQKDGKLSAKKSVLQEIEHPLARKILDMRSITARAKFLEPLLDGKDCVVFPDGKIHCVYNPNKLVTSRLSTNDPSVQNWPKRDPDKKKIRRAVIAPPGYRILASDYGALELRGVGMCSRDQECVRYIKSGADIHMDWAINVRNVYPEAFDRRHGKNPDEKAAMKQFRGEIKNELVFPAFYLSMAKSIGARIGLPEWAYNKLFDKFWDQFYGVKNWQQRQIEFYEKHGYVEMLSGRRQHCQLLDNPGGILSDFNCVNSPVQGSSSEIVVNAWNNLGRRAILENKPWLIGVFEIHDDLTFIVPEDKWDETVDIVAEEMTKPCFPWVNVPLLIEMSQGTNWADMHEFRKVSTEEYWDYSFN